jgi:hypothetical protein
MIGKKWPPLTTAEVDKLSSQLMTTPRIDVRIMY